jgi:hypothetical protein
MRFRYHIDRFPDKIRITIRLGRKVIIVVEIPP